MTLEGRRALIAAVRRVVFTGLILLAAWLLLLLSRGLATSTPAGVIGFEGIPSTADWSISWGTGNPVAQEIAQRLPATAWLLVLGGLLALVLAALFLTIGALISRVGVRSAVISRVIHALRLVLVSSGVSTPIFVGILAFLTIWIWHGVSVRLTPIYSATSWWPVYFVSLIPAWLLVQIGHGELRNWPEGLSRPYGPIVRHLSIKLVTSLLRLVGAILSISIVVEMLFNVPGMGRLIVSAINTYDFPVLFSAIWTFVLIVALVKLAADLIEIAYGHFARQPVATESAAEPTKPRGKITNGWLITLGVLILLSIILLAATPAFTADPLLNNLRERLQPPGAGHILGTDQFGRDVLSRLINGLRSDVVVALLVIPGLLVIATGLAILAAYLRKMNGWVGDTLEDLVMLPRDTLCAFPWLGLLVLLSTFGLIDNVFLVHYPLAIPVGLVLFPRALGMMREAYRSPPSGRSWPYSILWSIPVVVSMAMAGTLLYSSTLGFLGLSLAPPHPELGGMLGESLRIKAPWIFVSASLLLVIFNLVWVMVGDALLEKLGFRSKAVWSKVVE